MRPTLRLVILFAIGVPPSLAVMLIEPQWWPAAVIYPAAVLGLFVVDGMLGVSRRDLTVRVVPPTQLYIGGGAGLEVVLRSAARADTVVDLVCDVGALLRPAPPVKADLPAGGEVRIDIPLTPERRGTARVDRLWLRWRGAMGLAERQWVHAVDAAFPVLPNVRGAHEAAVLFSSRDAPFGNKAQRLHGEGSEFEALREYVPGLDHRAIDWKHSARHHSLVCKEFRAERNHHIVLAFDTGHLMGQPLAGVPRLDIAINAGLALGYACLRGGDLIGVYGFDSRSRVFAEPTGGVRSFGNLQHAAATLDYGPEETNFTLGMAELQGRLKRRSLIVLLTDFVDTITAELMIESLERLARRHLIVFVTLRDQDLHEIAERRPTATRDVTRAVIADDFLRDRRVVVERLRRLGVLCLDSPAERIGAGLINQYLAIKRSEMI
jgi:uncharacterized protein (DUF58 family)